MTTTQNPTTAPLPANPIGLARALRLHQDREAEAARGVYARAVTAAAFGRGLPDAEVPAFAAALRTLGRTADEADADAALLAGLPGLRAAVAALPSVEAEEEERAKMKVELEAEEDKFYAATRRNQHSTQMADTLGELRARFQRFGGASAHLRRTLADNTKALAGILAVCPLPLPAEDNPGPAKARKAVTVAAK